MPGSEVATRIQKWRMLVEKSRELLPTTPHLAADHAAFEAVVSEIEALDARSEDRRAERNDAFFRRRIAEQRGIDLRGKVAAVVVSILGPRSELLTSYGIGPRPRTLPRVNKAAVELKELKEQAKAAEATAAAPKPATFPPPESK